MNSIDRKKIIELMLDKKVQDYTFIVVFFIVFSFFVVFAIRPNIVTAFNLQKELQEIKLHNREFEEEIMQIVTYQSTLETYRNDMSLLDEAIPESPEIAKVVEDIRQSATDSGVILDALNVESVEYSEKARSEGLQVFSVSAEIQADIQAVQKFLQLLAQNRRLKLVDEFNITQSNFTPGQENGINIYTIVIKIDSTYL